MCPRARAIVRRGSSAKRIEMEKAELILLVLVAVLEVASPELAAIRELFLRESCDIRSLLQQISGNISQQVLKEVSAVD